MADVHALRHLGIGLLAVFVLLAGKALFEKTWYGPAVDMQAYETLQRPLPASPDLPVPVVVIDITKVKGGKDQPTPRKRLEDLLTAIAAEGPAAVAVDIEFSPNETGWVTPEDPDFFEFCLALKHKRQVPIYLGVYRSRADKPDTWLGLPQYAELAAAGIAKYDDTRRLPRWVLTRDAAHPLHSIGQALAASYRADLPGPPKWIAWALEPTYENPLADLESRVPGRTLDVLVNYSRLEKLIDTHKPATNPVTIEDIGEELKGKLVILGDASGPADSFNVPGEKPPQAGVYLMASAAYTLAVEPLYEFRSSTRFLLDLAISVFIVLGAYVITKGAGSAATTKVRRDRFLLWSIIGVLLSGLALVRFMSILWLDFFLVVLAIILHPPIERWLVKRLRAKRHARRQSHA